MLPLLETPASATCSRSCRRPVYVKQVSDSYAPSFFTSSTSGEGLGSISHHGSTLNPMLLREKSSSSQGPPAIIHSECPFALGFFTCQASAATSRLSASFSRPLDGRRLLDGPTSLLATRALPQKPPPKPCLGRMRGGPSCTVRMGTWPRESLAVPRSFRGLSSASHGPTVSISEELCIGGL